GAARAGAPGGGAAWGRRGVRGLGDRGGGRPGRGGGGGQGGGRGRLGRRGGAGGRPGGDRGRRRPAAGAGGGGAGGGGRGGAGVLSRVLCQDVERRESGPVIRSGTAPDRTVSVHDPEMRHGRKSATKRFDGHKAAVAVDTDEQLVTAVDVLAGNAPDAEGALD